MRDGCGKRLFACGDATAHSVSGARTGRGQPARRCAASGAGKVRIRPTPTPAAATDADALHANARMQAGCLFGKHADERQHAQVLHLAGILSPCPLVLVLARPSIPMVSPACLRAGRFCRVPAGARVRRFPCDDEEAGGREGREGLLPVNRAPALPDTHSRELESDGPPRGGCECFKLREGPVGAPLQG